MRIISVFTILLIALTGLQSQDKPNVLWITLEDTSPHFIGAYGNKQVKTPNIDKLAKEGVVFNNAFSNGTVCSPSRSTIITGCLTMVTGTGNHRSNYTIPKEICGFPKYLKDAGYYTSNNKKTDYNTKNAKYIIKQSWHESSGKAGWWKREEGQPFFSVFNHNDCHQSRTMTNPYAWYEEKILSQLNDQELTASESIEMPPFYRDTPEMRKHFVRVHNSLNVTDKQVGELLKKLEKDGLKENTIIFCYADHGEGIPRGKCNPIGFGYRVPFIVWFPEKYKHLSPWEIGKPTEELVCFEDLAPTMLSLAGVEIPSYMKGRPFLGTKRKS
ncbi:MAG: sulfatase, partial [Bacteroidales bacterium]|nr:sulfatase [Bacteroidales bacterium]